MGTVILATAFFVEIIFAIYCLTTRSSQRRARSFMRIGAFATFVLLALVSIIQWDARWYLLGTLLFVWATLGILTIIRKKTDPKAYKPARSVVKAIMTLLLVFVTITPALIFPQHKQPQVTGNHKVVTAKYTYTDENRIETFTDTGENRKVNVEFWYPQDGTEKYPLVVFDHGSGGVKTSNTSTFIDLASNGYVVCSIDHPYHSMFTVGTDGSVVRADPSYLQEYMALSSGQYDDKQEFEIEKKWMGLRIADINFVLDTILEQAKDSNSDTVYQLVDPEKIGLMGHSLGGESVAQVARERNDIDAVINLDADLGGEYLDYVNGKYVMNDTVYPVPLLTIYSDDLVRLIDAIQNAETTVAVKHVSATTPDAYEVHLTGTNHMSLTDLPLVSPFLTSMITSSVKQVGHVTTDSLQVINKMNEIVLSFFNVFLKDKGTFTTAGTY
jgi:dienelactone hydrolase